LKCDAVCAMHFRSAASRSLPREGRRMQMLVRTLDWLALHLYSRRIGHNNLSGGGYWFMLVFDDAQRRVKEEGDWSNPNPNPS